jgi:integrase
MPLATIALKYPTTFLPGAKTKGEETMSEGNQLCFGGEFSHAAIMRFDDLAREYLKYAKVHKMPLSYRRDIVSLNNCFLPIFGNKLLTTISTRDIEHFQIERATQVSPSTVNRDMETLRHMFNLAVDWGYLEKNPAQRVKSLKTPPGRIRYLSKEERDRLLDECRKNRRLYAVVVTALETGMRASELRNLTWSDINLPQRTIILSRTKNNETRILPISDTLLALLEKLLQSRNGSKSVFSKSDGTPYRSWRTAFENALKSAGIEAFRFHDLRHTFASYLVMSGVNIRTVQELLGHKDIKMTTRYSHLSHDHLLEAVNGISSAFAGNTGQADGGIRTLGQCFTKALLYH